MRKQKRLLASWLAAPGAGAPGQRLGTHLLSAMTPLLWLLIALFLFVLFITDLWMPAHASPPMCYVAALLLVVALPAIRHKIVVAVACTTLTAIDYFLSPPSVGAPMWFPFINHGLTIILIWFVLLICLRHSRTENALRRSEQRFRALVEASSQIVWTTDVDGNVVDDSPSWRAFTGQTYEQWKGSGWLAAYHPDDRKRIQANWQRVTADKIPLEAQYRLRRHDGQWRWTLVRAVPLLDTDGSMRGWIGMNTDITERKQAENDTLFLLDTGECIRLAADPDELIWALAVALGEHLQVSRCGFVEIDLGNDGLLVHRDYHPGGTSLAGTHALRSLSPAVINPGKGGRTIVVRDVATDERTVEHADAYHRFGVSAYVAVPLLRDGQLVAALAVGTEAPRDWNEREVQLARAIAERAWLAVEKLRLDRNLRHSEEALREADQRKDEFLATLAHELRNPLSLIRNVVSLIQIPGSSEEELRWGRDIIERQVNYLTRLTDDLFDVSRISRNNLALHKEEAELNEIIKAAVESSRVFIDQRGHELEVTLSPEPMFVDADNVRLVQVFMNLLSNAAKYTPKPGRIWLRVERQGKTAVVRVIDSGVGIAPENLPHIFALFYQVDRSYTRAEGGLGLGLTLVRRLVELHSGSIEARSAGINRGSEFVVRLPLLAAQGQTSRLPTEKSNGEIAAPKALRILVADDFPQSAEALAKLLRLDGNQVQIAHDGFAALDVAETFRPQVALLDLAMPNLNGYETARMIRQQPWGRDMLLIALTGWGRQQERLRTEEAGFDAHLTKPVKYEAILDILSSLPLKARKNTNRLHEL